MLRPYTLNLDDSLMMAAKSKALQDRTSVSEMVRRLLSEHLGLSNRMVDNVPDEKKIIETLESYSSGQLKRSEAMRAIGLDPVELETFTSLMNEYGISWPEVGRERAEKEGEYVARAIAFNSGEIDEY
ncbi:MAG: hypothetical protein A4E57_02617 [Syntrophorhabdaceae bacterium PtaU1.Bin034]|nr:MAG: hypothetical protein A4E57_02617 [Syntrophorhabdaceae bacterium PtaU1.Bin034]